jgi:hypothetical protein
VTRIVWKPRVSDILQPDEWPPGLVRFWPLRLFREVLTPKEWRQEAGRRWRLGR